MKKYYFLTFVVGEICQINWLLIFVLEGVSSRSDAPRKKTLLCRFDSLSDILGATGY